MSVSKEAIEAALTELRPLAIHPDDMERALTAALPFLARPAPSQSDEERAREVWAGIDGKYSRWQDIAAILATVRAEATLAGAAAEREAIAVWVEQWGGENAPANIAAAIRARKP